MSGYVLSLAFSGATLAALPNAQYPVNNTVSLGYNTPERAPPTAPVSPAPSPADEFAAHPLTLEARLGLGTPTGVLGVAVTYSPVPAFGFECGAGTNTLGLQLACSLRGRVVLGAREPSLGLSWARALTLTSGFSGGRYADTHVFERMTAVDGPGPAELDFARAYWWNTDLGVEWRDGAFVSRFAVGVALLLNPNAYTVFKKDSESRVEPASTTLLYFGFGLGGAP